jgi:plasmid stabilization system protein ParE
MIFYRYNSKEPVVLIVQVHHGSQDLEVILDQGD